jgi:hypothetical protein
MLRNKQEAVMKRKEKGWKKAKDKKSFKTHKSAKHGE